MVRATIIIDYQNMHLTAHEEFCSISLPKHESLIHPLHFAHQVIHARASGQVRAGADDQTARAVSLSRVAVFRGLPSHRLQAAMHRRALAQKAEWATDPRVDVAYRPLKYRRGSDGRWTAQEKGIDVQVALEVVKATFSGTSDIVILAAHDTDLEPALEYALDSNRARTGQVRIETAGWNRRKRLQVPGRPIWHTTLDIGHYARSRDRKVYS